MKELLPEIWKNKMQIAEGIKNLAFKKEHIEQLAQHRKEICKTCIWFNQNQKGKSLQELPEVITKLKSEEWLGQVLNTKNDKCIHCGCGLGEHSMKLRCLSCACPVGKWQAVTSTQEQQEIEKIIDSEQ